MPGKLHRVVKYAQHFDNVPVGRVRDPKDDEVAAFAFFASYMECVQSSSDIVPGSCAGSHRPVAQRLQCGQDRVCVESCLLWAEMIGRPPKDFYNIRFGYGGQADNPPAS